MPGFDICCRKMSLGSHCRVKLASELCYGEDGLPPKIPPNAPLEFEMELLRILEDDEGQESSDDEDEDTDPLANYRPKEPIQWDSDSEEDDEEGGDDDDDDGEDDGGGDDDEEEEDSDDG